MSKVFFGCFFALIVITLLTLFEVWVVMALWNWLMPLFWASAPILTFGQTFGILILINIIASAFRTVVKK